RYLLFALGGGLGLLVAVAWTAQATGTLAFVPGGFVSDVGGRVATTVLLSLFVVGVSVKAAVMPFHAWLPGAMVAPTPVSALLHAVAVVKAGVFGVLRVVGYVFGPETFTALGGTLVLGGAAMLTILVGSILALRQQHLKRRLAYSTIVHLSYIVLAAALATPMAFAGAVLHLVNHGVAKITLFFVAGSIYASTKREGISELAGLGRRMPWTFAAFGVASLALVGVPAFAGFPSKLWMAQGAVEGGKRLVEQ
ncbi:MAG TPA: proton-conducting transporter membrane subunit, partial [Gemmatimonadaceae bacterium]|nr:proton-conducting transporter membrane subunit [Gemmatimonadaceae bacterium]